LLIFKINIFAVNLLAIKSIIKYENRFVFTFGLLAEKILNFEKYRNKKFLNPDF